MSTSSSRFPSPSFSSSSSNLINYFYLDAKYSLMTGKMVHVLYAFFKLLDVHDCDSLNDLQFYHLMRRLTKLSTKQIYQVFDMLDTDASGTIDFDEFYLLICILVAQKDREIKKFIHRHSRTVFDLLDTDGSNEVSMAEFAVCGFLFNFHNQAIKKIFQEFDCSDDQELDYREFRLFAMACIDKQQEMEMTRRTRFWSQQEKEMPGVIPLDVESRKSKLEAITAAAKLKADAAGSAKPEAKAVTRISKPEEGLTHVEAETLLEKSKRDSETGKAKVNPDKSKAESESLKSKAEARPRNSRPASAPVGLRETETNDGPGKSILGVKPEKSKP